MLNNLNSIGADTYASWSDEQRRFEIGNLVEGFKSGLPIQIVCQLATQIAGTPALASEHISAFMTLEERKALVKNESGTNKELRSLLKATLL